VNGFATPTRTLRRRVSYRDAADVIGNANASLDSGRVGMGKLGQLQTAYPDDAWTWDSKTPHPGTPAAEAVNTNLFLGIGAAVLVIVGGVLYMRS